MNYIVVYLSRYTFTQLMKKYIYIFWGYKEDVKVTLHLRIYTSHCGCSNKDAT